MAILISDLFRMHCISHVSNICTAVWLKEIADRLETYNEFSGQAHVRQLLATRGGISAQVDVIGKRLAELKGLEAPEEAFPR